MQKNEMRNKSNSKKKGEGMIMVLILVALSVVIIGTVIMTYNKTDKAVSAAKNKEVGDGVTAQEALDNAAEYIAGEE